MIDRFKLTKHQETNSNQKNIKRQVQTDKKSSQFKILKHQETD